MFPPGTIRSLTPQENDSQSMTGESSGYPSLTSYEYDDSASVSQTVESASNRRQRRSRSAMSRRTSFSRTPTSYFSTRPSTTSGRKSRATTVSSFLGTGDAQDIVCAISEARGVTPSVGIAFVNVSLGEVTLSQICDNQNYSKTIHKLQLMSPSNIIFPSTVCPPNRQSGLFQRVKETMPAYQVDGFDRSAWSESDGVEYIENLAFSTDIGPIKVAIEGKFYATTSFSAAMKYIEQNLEITFAHNSLRISYTPSEDTMMIDISAFQSLEVMQNLRDAKSKSCLFGLLNTTLTPMGSRMLRSNILQPPTNQENFIIPRYEALAELTSNEEMFRGIRQSLKGFHDVEKLLTKLIITPTGNNVFLVESLINHVLMVKSFLEAIPVVFAALSSATSDLLVKARRFCNPHSVNRILRIIREMIEPDVTYTKTALDLRNQRTFAVKAGVCGILDVSRQTYKELTEEIHKHLDVISDQYRLCIKLKYDNGRKYWFRLRAADLDGPLPQIFINVVKKKDQVECQTLELVKLNLRLSDASNEVVMRSDEIIYDLVKKLREEASVLFKISESIALVDMIASFAQLATIRDYIRPEIKQTLALKAARHPILEKDVATSFVPNDYYSSESSFCFHIVTGCNMSGKSTYIKTVALLQIMAQVGSFVPAEYAAFPIINHIFARVSMDDSIESNLSTFSIEMREMAFILRNIDDKSMAIIDELGRGTSTRDGLAIAIAMSEALIQSRASVWFATHFIDVARVLADRPGVLNLHLSAKSSTTRDGRPQIIMLYKVTNNSIDEEQNYGIHLARAMGLPSSFIETAEHVSNDLRQRREAKQRSSESSKLNHRRRLILQLHEALKQARDSGNEAVLPGYLKRLQEEFIVKMAEVEQARHHLAYAKNDSSSRKKQLAQGTTKSPRMMSAIFNLHSIILVLLLAICTSTYVHAIFPRILDANKDGSLGIFWKFARIGERLSPYVSLACVLMAVG
ncbi:unnamed protein product [Clonostachys chloroleuca]|uniref:DNA mismatch repair protein MSH3 n=1 Tax=Clonostachys chloroleuca TaxID=1926264 RepID=A0AA35QCM6_9HYPO|nr:unnamed protein product [Clonostachys chloroleuca]